MILKVLTEHGEWELFDNFDRLKYNELGKDEKPTVYIGNCWDVTEYQKAHISESNKKLNILLWRDGSIATQIISQQPVYVLNNNGKTIEKI